DRRDTATAPARSLPGALPAPTTLRSRPAPRPPAGRERTAERRAKGAWGLSASNRLTRTTEPRHGYWRTGSARRQARRSRQAARGWARWVTGARTAQPGCREGVG